MPENVECKLMSEYLHKHYSNNVCVRLLFGPKSKYFNKPIKGFSSENWIPIDGWVTVPINMKCLNIDSKGKKIGFFFDEYCFIFSLGLEGSFRLTPANNTGLIIEFDHQKLYYDDSRRFGNFYLIHRNQLPEIMKDVGPDYLRGEVSLELFVNVIRTNKISHHEVGWFLMQQKYLAGVGNYIRNDAMYLAQISPYRLLSSLSDNDLLNLYYSIMKVMTESYTSQGKTIATYKNIDGALGGYINYCYGRKIDNNGNPIITCTLNDKRTTHWCPNYQF